MRRQEASAHAALWKDLLTRSPEHARTPVASLAAFGALLQGNGMASRLALERVTDPGDRMARLITAMVAVGADPTNSNPPQSASSPVQERLIRWPSTPLEKTSRAQVGMSRGHDDDVHSRAGPDHAEPYER